MINNVSWQGYWTALAIILGIYYLILYFKFFRTGPPASISRTGKESENQSWNFDSSKPHQDTLHQEIHVSNEMHSYQSGIDELTAFFEQARYRKWVSEELIHALTLICKKYDILIYTEYRETINDFIVKQAEEKCSIHLSNEEVETVWLRM